MRGREAGKDAQGGQRHIELDALGPLMVAMVLAADWLRVLSAPSINEAAAGGRRLVARNRRGDSK